MNGRTFERLVLTETTLIFRNAEWRIGRRFRRLTRKQTRRNVLKKVRTSLLLFFSVSDSVIFSFPLSSPLQPQAFSTRKPTGESVRSSIFFSNFFFLFRERSHAIHYAFPFFFSIKNNINVGSGCRSINVCCASPHRNRQRNRNYRHARHGEQRQERRVGDSFGLVMRTRCGKPVMSSERRRPVCDAYPRIVSKYQYWMYRNTPRSTRTEQKRIPRSWSRIAMVYTNHDTVLCRTQLSLISYQLSVILESRYVAWYWSWSVLNAKISLLLFMRAACINAHAVGNLVYTENAIPRKDKVPQKTMKIIRYRNGTILIFIVVPRRSSYRSPSHSTE